MKGILAVQTIIWLLFLATFLGLPTWVKAETWIAPDTHQLVWDANPSTEMVEGYRVYVESTGPNALLANQVVGLATRIPLVVFDLPQGRYRAWVTAYNPLGESGPSNVVPFVLVRSVPGDPGGVSAPAGAKIVPLN